MWHRRNLVQFSVPIRFHGDDASIKSLRATKLLIASLHGEFGPRDSLFSRMLSFYIEDDLLIPGRSLPEIMEAWVWSWKVAFDGVHPAVDHAGKEWDRGSERSMLAMRSERA